MSTFSWSYKADERPSARIAARPTVIGGTRGAEYDVCLLRYGQRTQGRSTQATILSTRFLLPRSARSSTMPTARSLCGRCRMTSVWPCAIPMCWCSCYRPADSELQHFFSAFQGLARQRSRAATTAIQRATALSCLRRPNMVGSYTRCHVSLMRVQAALARNWCTQNVPVSKQHVDDEGSFILRECRCSTTEEYTSSLPRRR